MSYLGRTANCQLSSWRGTLWRVRPSRVLPIAQQTQPRSSQEALVLADGTLVLGLGIGLGLGLGIGMAGKARSSRETLPANNMKPKPAVVVAEKPPESQRAQRYREEGAEAYLKELLADKELVHPLLGGTVLTSVVKCLAQQIVDMFTATARGMNARESQSFIFGHPIHWEVRDEGARLKHHYVTVRSDRLEIMTDHVLKHKELNTHIPDCIEHALYVYLMRVLSSVLYDVLLSMKGHIGDGRFTLGWTPQDLNAASEEEIQRSIDDAIRRIDLKQVQVAAADMAAAGSGMPLEGEMYRIGVIMGLVLFHCFFTRCEVTMMGCRMKPGLPFETKAE